MERSVTRYDEAYGFRSAPRHERVDSVSRAGCVWRIAFLGFSLRRLWHVAGPGRSLARRLGALLEPVADAAADMVHVLDELSDRRTRSPVVARRQRGAACGLRRRPLSTAAPGFAGGGAVRGANFCAASYAI